MHLTPSATRRTLHGSLRTWCVAMSAWSVETRCAPPRRFKDARVYGQATTAMHDMSAPRPLPKCGLPAVATYGSTVPLSPPRPVSGPITRLTPPSPPYPSPALPS